MKKRIIVTKAQLNEYIERKKAQKVVNSIMEEMYKNSKNLNEQISLTKANNSIVEKYRSDNKITPQVEMILKEYGIIDDDGNEIM